jgi:two-component system response regulator WspF
MAAESLRRVVNKVADYQLVWVAYDGREALRKCRESRPDIVLMDLVMPDMDGVEATRAICAEFHCAILVVAAGVDTHAGKVFEAMGAGALDAVNTPVLGSGGVSADSAALISKINTIATLLNGNTMYRDTDATRRRPLPRTTDGIPLIAIGASTGGPSALRDILLSLPANLGAAITVVQHVDAEFVTGFTHWLDEQVPLRVRAARAGEPPAIDTVLVGGREDHLVLDAHGRLAYNPEPRTLVYRPSVDVFFNSVAKYYTNQAIGVLLTGMGRDGASGLKTMRERGWWTIAQDRSSCAVYGMPKAAQELDAAREILSLENIGSRLLEWTEQVSPRGKEQHTSV